MLRIISNNGVLPFVAVIVLGCSGNDSQVNPLLTNLQSPTEDILDGCKRARKKCTVCHTIERLLHSKMKTPQHWKNYVTRMRRMPGGGISAADAPLIVNCLVYRDFGNDGLKELKESSK